ncbi:HET-domain-containing protein, partial [Lepidopterella palustris CBS 459.81]
YPQLDETVESIRLIRLEPGSGKDIINCTLESTTLENKPTFDALSYAWGESTDVSLIEVNGVMVEINESLWDALHHLRSETKAITLWVDALCIDQQNAEEKSRQVPLMDEIYNRAQTVHVWLG